MIYQRYFAIIKLSQKLIQIEMNQRPNSEPPVCFRDESGPELVYSEHNNFEDSNISHLQYCYFCKQRDMNSCVNRSLYHKYNDTSDKYLRDLERILKKQKSLSRYIFDEIKFDIDQTENFRNKYNRSKAQLEILELFQYYKFRRYVPVFTKSKTALSVTESIYYYYYERLKIYYNDIKRELNMTVEPSSKSEQSQSKLSDSDLSSRSNLSNILLKEDLNDDQFNQHENISSQSIIQYQTQSKALQDVLKLLKKKQQQLNRIKTFKTQDFYTEEDIARPLYRRKKLRNIQESDPFTDSQQRVSMTKTTDKPTLSTTGNNSHLKLGNVMIINQKLKRKNQHSNLLNKYIGQIRALKQSGANTGVKLRKQSQGHIQEILAKTKEKSKGFKETPKKLKCYEQYSPYHTSHENQFLKNQTIYELYRNTDNCPSRSSLKKNKQSKQSKSIKKLSDLREENPCLFDNLRKQHVKSLPKILMEFQVKPDRSSSSQSLKNPHNQILSHRFGSKMLPVRRQINDSPYKKRHSNLDEIKTNQMRKGKNTKNEEGQPSRLRSNQKLTRNSGSKKKIKVNKHSAIAEQHSGHTSIDKNSLYNKMLNQNHDSQMQKNWKKNRQSIEIEKQDNIASVRRKKLQELKLKSNKKKKQ